MNQTYDKVATNARPILKSLICQHYNSISKDLRVYVNKGLDFSETNAVMKWH